ncbi:hypothetical protein [Rubellimicrobium sp. CFH 75288]|uniref:hypothetical protein n=1 Tax=Rubellimicrobium sp. CFH 75288 TaxID=2697034 RepID=UPI0014134DE6|nr:hypothetical protein [Rubellimicrobium sp. CFH 75288]NAZ38237.1 hypothetical protein [Rubellimicrobium sp. CFH 75288]
MGSDIRKFVNPKFLGGIDVLLMRDLFARHFAGADQPFSFDGEPGEIRERMAEYFANPITEWSEGLVADLHRVAEVGSAEGMQLVLNEARRQGVALYPEEAVDASDPAPARHEPKHVALHAYLNHPRIFEAAADFQALRAPTAMAEFRGPQRDVGADLTDEASAAFKAAIVKLFAQDLQGDYCRLGPYEEDGEINLVVSHGAPVTTTPVVAGDGERIITLRAVKYAALRYAPYEGLLRIGGVPKAQQAEVAAIFAEHILGRPGFFAGKDARDLYTLDPIAAFGPDFAFRHAFDDRILEVRIVAAAADFFAEDEDGNWRHVRSWESKDPSGGALRHFKGSEVRFGRGWRLGEITFRVFFRSDAKQPAKVTVRLKPPGTLAFRRTRFEKAIHALVARNGLEKDRDADLVVEAAE